MMADGYHVPQPAHREIWIVGLQLNEIVYNRLMWFECFKTGRVVRYVHTAEELYTSLTRYNFPVSLGHFFGQLSISNSSYDFLYRMLEPEDYENLMVYLLRDHPYAKDVTKEDYVLSLFIEHGKKKNEVN